MDETIKIGDIFYDSKDGDHFIVESLAPFLSHYDELTYRIVVLDLGVHMTAPKSYIESYCELVSRV